MKKVRQLYVGAWVTVVMSSACGGAPMPNAAEEAAMPDATRQAQASGDPVFQVDPWWPQALPEDWMFGNVVGVAADSQDNVWVVHRPRSQNGSEGTPPVLAFDTGGQCRQELGWEGHCSRMGDAGARTLHRLRRQRLGWFRRWPALRHQHAGNDRQRPFPEAFAERRTAPRHRRIRDGHRG